jgi:hypothetical protein
MGDPKLLTRLREFCEAYKVEYAFEGTVEGFDTIDIVDPERLTRGLYVSREKDRRLVGLDSKKKPPVEVGDTVIVVGRDARYEENRVVPAVILIPKGHYSLFSTSLQTHKPLAAILLNLSLIPGLILVILASSVMPQMEPLLFFLLYTILFLSYCIDSYLTDRFRKPRLYYCDEETWHLLIGEISTKFGVTLTV